MSFSVSISRIRFSSGQEVLLEPGQVLVLVGPNNSGKSTALREIVSVLEDSGGQSKVVSDVSLAKTGDRSEFIAWMGQTARVDDQAGVRLFRGVGFAITDREAGPLWEAPRSRHLTRAFVRLLDASGRLNAIAGAQVIDLLRVAPSHPLHLLCLDDALESRLSEHFYRAFGMYLTLDRGAGSSLPLFCGLPQAAYSVAVARGSGRRNAKLCGLPA